MCLIREVGGKQKGGKIWTRREEGKYGGGRKREKSGRARGEV